jgi:hypothetical protein
VKPGVDVRKVTGPTNPDADTRVVEYLALPATEVVSEVGVPWTIVSAVTASEKLQRPASLLASVSAPVIW